MKQTINQSTFDTIWDIIKDRYNVGNWMTCSMSKIDRSERLEIKMQDAFNLIESITLSLVEKNASSNDSEDDGAKVEYEEMKNTLDSATPTKIEWKPLEMMVEKYPNDLNIDDFMYMGTVIGKNDRGINLYKNSTTRSYINIDSEGYCWKYNSNGYPVSSEVRGSYYWIPQEIAINEVNR